MERVVEALRALDASFAEVPKATMYDILRLRSTVFVVEQDCVYLDADGRDTEEGSRHLWVEDGAQVVACARLLVERDGSSIGRVATEPGRRRQGLGTLVVRRALDLAPRPVRISAQSHLVGWYGRFGFTTSGAEFLEDGIPHTPMVVP